MSAMSVSVVLRLAPEALSKGRLAGEVELVSSGERALVGSAEELVGFLASRTAEPAETASSSEDEDDA